MKVLKFLLSIILIFLVIVFVVQNYGQAVKIKFFPSRTEIEMDFVIMIFIAFLIGLFIGMLYCGFHILAAKNKLRVLQKEYDQLKKEIDLLRNQGIIEDETIQ